MTVSMTESLAKGILKRDTRRLMNRKIYGMNALDALGSANGRPKTFRKRVINLLRDSKSWWAVTELRDKNFALAMLFPVHDGNYILASIAYHKGTISLGQRNAILISRHAIERVIFRCRLLSMYEVILECFAGVINADATMTRLRLGGAHVPMPTPNGCFIANSSDDGIPTLCTWIRKDMIQQGQVGDFDIKLVAEMNSFGIDAEQWLKTFSVFRDMEGIEEQDVDELYRITNDCTQYSMDFEGYGTILTKDCFLGKRYEQ